MKWGSSIRIRGHPKSDGGRFGDHIWPDPNQKVHFSSPTSEQFFWHLLHPPTSQTVSETLFSIFLYISGCFFVPSKFSECQSKGMCWVKCNGLEEGLTPFLKMARFQNVRSQRWTAGFRSFLHRLYYMCSY